MRHGSSLVRFVHAHCFSVLAGLMLLSFGLRFAEAQRTLEVNPYDRVQWDQVEQHKANLHTHTTQSDGGLSPDAVIDEYHRRGYTALALTDHDRCTYPWPKFGRDPGQLGIVAIAGNELSRHHHTLSLFCEFATDTRDWNAAIEGVGAAGGVAVIAHPAMHWPRERRQVPGLQVSLVPPLRAVAQGDFTVEAWFRTTDAGRNILMGSFAAGRGGALNLELHTENRVRLYLAPAGQGRTVDVNASASGLDINTRDGRWHHLAGVRRGQEVMLYLDGHLAGQRRDMAGSFDLQGNAYYIGRDTRTDSTTFEGDLDHVRLWQRGLATEDIAALVRGAAPGQPGGPAAEGLLVQYTFDHAAGEALQVGTTIARAVDDSGKHPQGPFPAAVTSQGAPAAVEGPPEVLQRAGASRVALRFASAQGEVTGVPDDVVERYAELFRTYPHLLGHEVLNGTRPLREYPLDRELWDKLLAKLMPNRPVWGFATDDMHSMTHLGRDWILVLTHQLNEGAVRDAITRGAFFFASIRLHEAADQSVETTPRIERVDHDATNGIITVRATEGGRLLAGNAYRWIADGKTVHVGPSLNYRTMPGIGTYVRAEVTGGGGTVFTNPFGFRQR